MNYLVRVIRVWDGFFCNMSVTYDGAVLLTVVAQTSYVVGALYFDRKPMK